MSQSSEATQGRSIKKPNKIQNKPAETFKESVKSKVTKLKSPYAILCIFSSPSDETVDEQANIKGTNWHPQVKKALARATHAERHIIIDSASHLAVLLNNSHFDDTNKLTRIIRNHLMRNHPNNHLSIAAAQIDSNNIDIDNLLTDVCANLSRNIEERSSRVQVVHYKT